MGRYQKATVVILGTTVVCYCLAAGLGAEKLDAEALRSGLRTRTAAEDAFVTYVAVLNDQGRLPAGLVESTFQWARRKPEARRFYCFREALTLRAAEKGIILPRDTPALTGTIEGRVFTRPLLVEIPVPHATVTLGGTNRSVKTDLLGRYAFENVPLGTYTVRATGLVGVFLRSASAQAMLPSRPPGNQPVVVDIELR